MATGLIAITKDSSQVTGTGTSFTTELASGGFIVFRASGADYTMCISSIQSDTQLTLVSNYRSSSASALDFNFIPQNAMAQVTAAIVAKNAEALTGFILDKQNWQKVFSSENDIEVVLPDGSKFTGPSWKSLANSLSTITNDISGLSLKYEASPYTKMNPQTFATGASINNATQALALDNTFSDYYVWTGAFPKIVLENSSPQTSGGIGPGAWSSIGKGTLRDQLSLPNGTDLIGYKSAVLTNALNALGAASLHAVNVCDPKFAGGAVGDWNSTTKQGTDSSAAFQAAIDSLTTTFRAGGYRAIRVPTGNYKVHDLVLRQALEFGVMFIGDGKYNSILWGDETSSNPTITSEIEFVHFHGLSLYGSRSQGTSPSTWGPCFYRGKLANGAPDVDATFSECALGHSVDFIQAYGRGVVIDNTCVAFFITNLVNIVADPSIVFGTQSTNTAETGMRNYNISPGRTDVVSRMVKVSGTAYCKDFINDVNIFNTNMLSADYIAEFPDATITQLNVRGCSALMSFSAGLISGKRILNAILDVTTAKEYNRNTAATQFTTGLVTLQQGFSNLTIRGHYRNLIGQIVSVGAVSGALKVDIQVTNLATTSAEFVAIRGANVIGIDINILASGAATVGTCSFCDRNVQTSPQLKCNAYGANFTRAWANFPSGPAMVVGGSAVTLSSSQGLWRIENGVTYVDMILVTTSMPTSNAGEVRIGLPSTPAAEYPAISATGYTGSARKKNSTAKTIMAAEVDKPNSNIVLYKGDGTTVKGTDLSSTFVIALEAAYPA